jgi:hypothetical protein
MPKSNTKPTTAANLEAKFDAGEDVLDYFDLRTAKLVLPAKKVTGTVGRRAADQNSSEEQFERALAIAAQIEKLGGELRSILGKQSTRAGTTGVRKTKVAAV